MHTIRVSGDLDVRRINETRQLLLKSLTDSDGIVVDMSDVYRIDSAGLAGLVEVLQAARVSGRSFKLTRVRDGVMRVIRFARLHRVFFDAEKDGMIPSEGYEAAA
ncbi:MAG: STAS domain-containing protein [Rhodospirillales bacterium]|nr:STAS domain-containing protein [Rhodospirillales bacterium]